MSDLISRLEAIEDLDEQLEKLNELMEELMECEGEPDYLIPTLGVLERCWDQEDAGAFQGLGAYLESLDGDDEIDEQKVSDLVMESYSRGPCWKTLELIQSMVDPAEAAKFFKTMLQRDDLDDETMEALGEVVDDLGDDDMLFDDED
jgi:hypothetical protein